MAFTDDRSNVINIGDTVYVVCINTDRGAQMWMGHGKVVGFGRTRVKVQFPSRTAPQSVGAECLRITNHA